MADTSCRLPLATNLDLVASPLLVVAALASLLVAAAGGDSSDGSQADTTFHRLPATNRVPARRHSRSSTSTVVLNRILSALRWPTFKVRSSCKSRALSCPRQMVDGVPTWHVCLTERPVQARFLS